MKGRKADKDKYESSESEEENSIQSGGMYRINLGRKSIKSDNKEPKYVTRSRGKPGKL
jgi:hypothetical protein